MEPVPAAAARPLAASPRRALQALLYAAMQRRALPLADFSRPAVAFAPHPGDETLGCGGTIRLKRDSGEFLSCFFHGEELFYCYDA